jgi:hypothetical protein
VSETLSIEEQLLETWRIHDRIHHYLRSVRALGMGGALTGGDPTGL